LKRLIDKTQFAISTEETRYYLNGIYLHTIEVEGKALLRAVATDGHRLGQRTVEADLKTFDPGSRHPKTPRQRSG
jgi:DNA polymerase III sliding clamp (beta) subunit (PCNA family)